MLQKGIQGTPDIHLPGTTSQRRWSCTGYRLSGRHREHRVSDQTISINKTRSPHFLRGKEIGEEGGGGGGGGGGGKNHTYPIEKILLAPRGRRAPKARDEPLDACLLDGVEQAQLVRDGLEADGRDEHIQAREGLRELRLRGRRHVHRDDAHAAAPERVDLGAVEARGARQRCYFLYCVCGNKPAVLVCVTCNYILWLMMMIDWEKRGKGFFFVLNT